ncbi:hypothetical protein H7R52_18120 [Weissella confusa]|uniref:Uncharacterized protein n=1 Tax=Weissella confusa TaxID=1583 RepID=A0A923NHT2_WEICO|nr:hypothetical protein [Weissella confusa]
MMIGAVAQATDEFKSKLTSFAVAEFGNVQMYAGKNKISEELFSIILRRQKAGKVTVLTGDTFTRQHVFEPLLQGTLPEQNKYETVAEAVTAGELVITVYGGDYAERSNSVDDAFSDQEVEHIDYTEFVDSFTEALRKGLQICLGESLC